MLRGARSRRRRTSSEGGRYRRRLLVEQLCDRRVLAAISGAVFDDLDQSTHREAEESGLQDRLVYLDANDDGALSEGEPYRLTDVEGNFSFEGLGLGDYSVRLYNGAVSQRQTVPVVPQWSDSIELTDGKLASLSHDESQLYVLQDESLVQIDLATGAIDTLALPASVASLHSLPDGRLIALGEADAGLTGDAAWLVSFAEMTVTAIDFGLQEGETGWSSMAIDGSGQGILLAADGDGEATPIRQLVWADGTIHAVESANSVVAGANVLSDTDAVTSLIAVPHEQGLSLTQWSNASGTAVAGSSVEVAGGTALLAFDEAAGLAVVQADNGDLLVLDAAANMALLHRFDDLDTPLELDGHRERLYATDADGNMVIQDLVDPEIRETVALSEAAAGGIMLVEGGSAAIIAHPEHLRRLRLDRPRGHRVSLRQGEESADLVFGLFVSGDNDAPGFPMDVRFGLDEDTLLDLPAPTLIRRGVDPNPGDQFILLRHSDPNRGAAQTTPDGKLVYQPYENLNGTDSFQVRLHDGRSLSQPLTVFLDVAPVNDPPGPIIITVPSIPEATPAGTPVGTIQIVNPDIDEVLKIEVAEDGRFRVDGDQLILIEGGQLDYESESVVELQLVITDVGIGEQVGIETVMLQVGDSPEEITGIDLNSLIPVPEGIYTETTLVELLPVANVEVYDLDEGGSYDFELSDPRFQVLDGSLQIVPDSEFDFEQEPEIELTIHVSDTEGPFEYSETFTIKVEDVNELPTAATFSGDSVAERVAGDAVGEISVDDPDQPTTVQLSVDDSRFEFEGMTLKLREGVFVERSQQQQIQLTLTVADYAETEFVQTIDVTLEVLENDNPFHNDDLSADVNGDGIVEPADALMIINYLNRFGPGPIEEAVNNGNAEYFYDVNDDTFVTPLDALLVINFLNRQTSAPPPTVGGESESDDGAVPPPTGVPAIPTAGQVVEDSLVPVTSPAPAELASELKLGIDPFTPPAATSTPARATDLAMQDLSQQRRSPSDEDDEALSRSLDPLHPGS